MKRVVAIVGPTAVGKTKLSIGLAKAIDGEIINGDAMQIYRGLDIGTAKITDEEMDGVPHHLIDEFPPDATYSVAAYQQAVRGKIDEISARKKVPIIVGGTGLYVKSVLYDYEFKEESKEKEEQYDTLSNEEVHQLLMAVDPESGGVLHPNNRRRVVRALNIFNETHEKKSDALEKQEKKMLYDCFLIGLTDEREALYERINARVDDMLAKGLVDEIKGLRQMGVLRSAQSMQAIGYKEIYDYLDGLTDYETAVELVKRNSRRLAKRQFTWFNNQMNVTWYAVDVAAFGTTVTQIVQDTQFFLEK